MNIISCIYYNQSNINFLMKSLLRLEANYGVGLGYAIRSLSLLKILAKDIFLYLAARGMNKFLLEEFIDTEVYFIDLLGLEKQDELVYIKTKVEKLDLVINHCPTIRNLLLCKK